MSEIAVRVEHLGKRYRIGGQQVAYKTLRESLMAAAGAPIRWLKSGRSPAKNTFWALDDVSFEVKHGEAVGIIGRNGAGKSTLLKILSRITKPTSGRVDLYGRVGSLLEVGTGFHPELTGRENIYLNGAILGMGHAEIGRKFDEIIAFAEIDRFLDTPVKYYSSGMYVRLAFAVAAHLEPEILLVDEVLSVGDAEFQRKCLGKMGEVARGGRTVLFVSHNMSAVVGLCTRGIVIERGRAVVDGGVSLAVAYYTNSTGLRGEYRSKGEIGFGRLSIKNARIVKDGMVTTTFRNSETLVLQVECSVKEPIVGAQIAFELMAPRGECLFSSTSCDSDPSRRELRPGDYLFECPIDLGLFREGTYRIEVSSSVPAVEMLDTARESLSFQVVDDSSPLLRLGQGRRGLILPILEWRVRGPN